MPEYSYNGWPASPDKNAIGVVASSVFPGGAKSGDVTTVLAYVARQFNARVEPIVQGWGWGYTYKTNANNPSQLSCHASGTALDINAPDHPNGAGGTFTSTQRGEIYAILDEVQGTVSWLEGYDEMHFEICVDASTLAYVAAVLGDAAPPAGSTPPGDEDMPLTDEDLDKIAARVWDKMIAQGDNTQPAWAWFIQTWNNAKAAADKPYTLTEDTLIKTLRADEFRLTKDGQADTTFGTVINLLRSPEFDVPRILANTTPPE